MKNITLKYIILGLIFCTSCESHSRSGMTDEKSWHLGWRIFDSSMDENFELAESQFDSLLDFSTNIDHKFMAIGLEVKIKLNKNEEVLELLNSQDTEMLHELCERDLLKELAPCNGLVMTKLNNESLQIEIIKMYINDQYARGNLMTEVLDKYELSKGQVIVDSFAVNTDERNRIRLNEIINEHGFPTKELVGRDAMRGIFFIIQHSDGDKKWQKSQLKNIEGAVKNGDMDGKEYAYLYDRIQVNSGDKQLYGTQFSKVDPINGIVELAPTERIENLDSRRREIGMMPIDMYKRIMLKHM